MRASALRIAKALELPASSNLKASTAYGFSRDHHNQMTPITSKERPVAPRAGPTRCGSSGHNGHRRLGSWDKRDRGLPNTMVGFRPPRKGRQATEKVRQRQRACRPDGTVLQDARQGAGGPLHGSPMRRVSLPAAPFTKIGVQAPLDHAVRPWADLPSGQPTRSASRGSSPTGVPSPGVARPANPLPHESAVLGGARARRRPRAQGPQVMKPRWRHCLFQQSAGFRRRHTGPDSGHQGHEGICLAPVRDADTSASPTFADTQI